MSPNKWITCGAVLGGLGVLIGAFGAHGLQPQLEALGYQGADLARRLARYHTGAEYQMFHAPAIVLVAILLRRSPSKLLQAAAWAFLAGVAIFSGLLYTLAFAEPAYHWLGAIVPIGGVSLVAGWFALAAAHCCTKEDGS